MSDGWGQQDYMEDGPAMAEEEKASIVGTGEPVYTLYCDKCGNVDGKYKSEDDARAAWPQHVTDYHPLRWHVVKHA